MNPPPHDCLTPELSEWIANVRRVTDAATRILILFALLWFGTASIGASLP